MQGKGRVAAAALTAVLATGCQAAEEPAAFGRDAVRAEIRTVVAEAGMPESKLPGPGEETGTASPATDRERVARRAAACSAGWQYIGPVADGARGKYDKALTGLARAGWKESGKRFEQPVGEKGGDTMVQVAFKKEGWTLYARHNPSRALGADILSFIAAEDVCMGQFTEQETALLSGDEPREESGH
ncbi:hypothetical protein HHL19_03310 [Streptomyces sp. R302]|uniref:hypothetical protein n=1 Tax=unclassified Streptomyces TaxID=2593676 RepID=UPI00145ECDC1|nr:MULTISPECIES: hypothetical protein [unclassified Streptomyces]NML49378.1 hypothetical protein [Streptomyces sp. R301]NML77705.1 hypothetical protein [Streptomyces sp. R302]